MGRGIGRARARSRERAMATRVREGMALPHPRRLRVAPRRGLRYLQRTVPEEEATIAEARARAIKKWASVKLNTVRYSSRFLCI